MKGHITRVRLIDGRSGGIMLAVSKRAFRTSMMVTRGKAYGVLVSKRDSGTRLVHNRGKGDCGMGARCGDCGMRVMSDRTGCLHVHGGKSRRRGSHVASPVPNGIIGVPIDINRRMGTKSATVIVRTVGVRDGCGMASSYHVGRVLIRRNSDVANSRALVALRAVRWGKEGGRDVYHIWEA